MKLLVLGMSTSATVTLSVIGGILIGVGFSDSVLVRSQRDVDEALKNDLLRQALEHSVRSSQRLDMMERDVAALKSELRRI